MKQETTQNHNETDDPDIFYEDDKRTIRISMDKGEWLLVILALGALSIGGVCSWVL